jgi:hypothetical protein
MWKCAVLTVALASAQPMTAQQAGGTTPLVTNDVVEFQTNYRDLKDRIVKADAVIRGRVTGDGRVLVPSPLPRGRAPLLSTEYQIEAMEIYKSHRAASFIGARIPVVQVGGEAVVGDVRVRTEAMPHLLAPGGEVLLFLTFDEKRQSFSTTRSDTFSLRDGRIEVDHRYSPPFGEELDGTLSSDSQGNLWRAVREASTDSVVN